jgi:hypothetical protein
VFFEFSISFLQLSNSFLLYGEVVSQINNALNHVVGERLGAYQLCQLKTDVTGWVEEAIAVDVLY